MTISQSRATTAKALLRSLPHKDVSSSPVKINLRTLDWNNSGWISHSSHLRDRAVWTFARLTSCDVKFARHWQMQTMDTHSCCEFGEKLAHRSTATGSLKWPVPWFARNLLTSHNYPPDCWDANDPWHSGAGRLNEQWPKASGCQWAAINWHTKAQPGRTASVEGKKRGEAAAKGANNRRIGSSNPALFEYVVVF